MKTLLKLIVAVVVLHAVYRGGMAAYTYFQIRDEAERLILFDEQRTPEELKAQIVEIGVAAGAPLTAENVSVERNGSVTTASASYVATVEYFPRFTYSTPVSFRVSAFAAGPLKPGASTP